MVARSPEMMGDCVRNVLPVPDLGAECTGGWWRFRAELSSAVPYSKKSPVGLAVDSVVNVHSISATSLALQLSCTPALTSCSTIQWAMAPAGCHDSSWSKVGGAIS